MAIVTGKDAAVYATSSPSIAATNLATTTSDNLTFTVTDQRYRYWDPNVAVVVKANGTVVTPAKVQYCGGKVVFTSAPALPVTIASCNYYAYSKVAGAHSATLTLEREAIKDTRLGDSCQRVVMGPPKASISLEQFWADPTFFNALTGGTFLGLVVHDAGTYNSDNTSGGPRYECYGYIKSDQLKLDAGNVMGETVGFESTGDIYFSPS